MIRLSRWSTEAVHFGGITMLEVGSSIVDDARTTLYQPGITKDYGTPAWYSNAAHVDTMLLEIVRKWLLDVERHGEQTGMLREQPIEDFTDVLRVGHRAIEVRG